MALSFSQALCSLDVLRLRAFVTAAQQDDDRASSLLEVDAVSRAMVNTQFADSLPHGLHIARKTKGEAVQSGRHQDARSFVLEPRSPFPECLCLF